MASKNRTGGGGGDRTPPISWSPDGEPKVLAEGTTKRITCGVVVTRKGYVVEGQSLVLIVNNKARKRDLKTDDDGRASFVYVLPPKLATLNELSVEVVIGDRADLWVRATVPNPQAVPPPPPPEEKPTLIVSEEKKESETGATSTCPKTKVILVAQYFDKNGKAADAKVHVTGGTGCVITIDAAATGIGKGSITIEAKTTPRYLVEGVRDFVLTAPTELEPIIPTSPPSSNQESMKDFAKGLFAMLFGTGNPNQGGGHS